MYSIVRAIRFVSVLGLLLGVVLWAPSAQSQTVEMDLATDLTEAEFEAMLARLSDEQVRDILITQFAARQVEDETQGAGLLTNSREIVENLTTNAAILFLPNYLNLALVLAPFSRG